jgi:pepF/M3 family oligoendopeptidase
MSAKNDLGLVPHWDLSNVYPELESKELKSAFKKIKAYLEKHHIDKSAEGAAVSDPKKLAGILEGALKLFNAAIRLGGTVEAYIYSFVSTDSYNALAKRLLSEYEQLDVRLQKQHTQFQGWMGTVADLLPEALKDSEEVKAHAFYLQETAEQSKYLMSSLEEQLAAELNLSGANAWGKLQGTVTSQLTVEFESDGETEKLPMPALINLRTHPDPEVRKRAYEAESAAWKGVEEPLAAALNGIKGTVNTLNRRRGREDALHSSIDQARIDRPTLEAMLGAMKDSFPTFRKYLKAKAKRLGKKKLPWWDLFAPTGELSRRFSFPEARDFIIEQFGNFSPDLATFAKRAFDNNWIDAEQRDGKRGGAFCMSVPAVDESRILCNFDGSLDLVFTIAHELGHGFHNDCLVGKTELQTITPMTLAETASIMCETIVFEAALAEAISPQERLAILEADLISDTQVIVDIYSRYLFEKEIFERRAEAELSADDFSEIMVRAQKATYGDGLDEEHLQKYMWTWKPHYYSANLSFYNYPYAFGLLFAIGLYAIYQDRGVDFVPDYKGLLASTGEANAADLAARFGIDIRSKDFWAASLGVIGNRIDMYLEL